MKKILVVDDMTIFRDPIAASLRLAGYQTITAANGEEALQQIRAHRPDLVLLDASMPKMDGLTCLKNLRADPAIAATRVILLTALSDTKYIVAAGALGVRDYLLKSRFRLADLLSRIEKPDAPAPVKAEDAGSPPAKTKLSPPAAPTSGSPGVTPAGSAARAGATEASASGTGGSPPPGLSPLRSAAEPANAPGTSPKDMFLRRLGEAFSSKSLSGVVAQVIAMAGSATGDIQQLGKLISRDPMLSARVIQAANGAAYANRGGAVTNIPDAIRKVGFSAIRNLAAALGVFDCMPEAGPDGFDAMRHWQHSFAVAHLTEAFAAKIAPELAPIAYVVGLCHDITEIFVRTVFPNECQQVLELVERTGRFRSDVEVEVFGFTSAQMVGELLRRMSLPAAIREPIEQFHSSAPAQASCPLSQWLALADNYANGALLASGPNVEIRPVSKSLANIAAVPRPDPQALRSLVISMTVSLAQLSRAEEAKLLVPMLSAGSARLWVVRSALVSEFDTVSMALDALAETTTAPRLPQPEEAEQFDGLVLLGGADGVGVPAHQTQTLLDAVQRRRGVAWPLLVLATSVTPEGQRDTTLKWTPSVTLARLAQFAAVALTDSAPRVAA